MVGKPDFAELLSQDINLRRWRVVVEDGVNYLRRDEGIEFGLSCVKRTMHAWTDVFPSDTTVLDALGEVANFVDGNEDPLALRKKGLAVGDVAAEADDWKKVPSDKL